MGALQRFHRDDDAQMSFLAIAAVICFVALLAMVINTNDVVDERVRVQNVSDAMVLSSAAWSARGLNLVSFVNVLNTKLVTVAVLLNSLNDALPLIIAMAELQNKIGQAMMSAAFPPVAAAGAIIYAITYAQLLILKPLKQNIIEPLANSMSKCNGDDNSGTLWTMAEKLNGVAETFQKSVIFLGLADSIDIVAANGVTCENFPVRNNPLSPVCGLVLNGLLEDPSSMIELPLKPGSVAEDFCPHMQDGGSGYKLEGYSYSCSGDDRAPLSLGVDRHHTLLLPFRNLFAGTIFDMMVKKNEHLAGCVPTSGDEEGTVTMPLSNLRECQQYGATAKWVYTKSNTRPVTNAGWTVDDFIPWRGLRESSGGTTADQEDIIEGLEDLGEEVNVEPPNQPTLNYGEGYRALDPGTERSSGEIAKSCLGASPPASFPSPYPPYNGYSWVSERQVKDATGNYEIGGYFIRVDGERQPDPPPQTDDRGNELPLPPPTYVYTAHTYSLVNAGEKEMDEDTLREHLKNKGEDPGPSTEQPGACPTPEPLVLDKSGNYEIRQRYIGAVVQDMTDSRPFWSNFFSDPPEGVIAYSQAQVYNHLSEDTFTQDWRVRLERTSLLESFLGAKGAEVGMNISNQQSGTALSNFLRKVNNH